jgi:hypothetical protein
MPGQKQKYPVMLSEQEREQLTDILKRGDHERQSFSGRKCCCGAPQAARTLRLPACQGGMG